MRICSEEANYRNRIRYANCYCIAGIYQLLLLKDDIDKLYIFVNKLCLLFYSNIISIILTECQNFVICQMLLEKGFIILLLIEVAINSVMLLVISLFIQSLIVRFPTGKRVDTAKVDNLVKVCN